MPKLPRSPTSCGTKSIPRITATTTAHRTDGRAQEAGRAPRASGPGAGRDRSQGRSHRLRCRDDPGRAGRRPSVSGAGASVLRIRAEEPQMQQQLRAPVFEDKVVDHIVAGAKVTDKDVSKDELQKAGRSAGRNVRADPRSDRTRPRFRARPFRFRRCATHPRLWPASPHRLPPCPSASGDSAPPECRGTPAPPRPRGKSPTRRPVPSPVPPP
jgi:hypothetical protein